nr:hypothetical protein [Tanacetum cinerariifolium]
MESDVVTESNAENLLPIPSECEVTLEDKRECNEPISENSPVCDNHSDIFSDSKIDDDSSVYDDDFEDIEYVEASLSDPEIVSVEEENNVEEENVVHQEEEEVDLEDISQIQDKKPIYSLLPIIRYHRVLKIFADNPEGDIRFLEELLINDSILSHESSDSNFEDNPLIPRPPPEPPDAETDAGLEIPVVMNDKDKFDEDYHYFMFVKLQQMQDNAKESCMVSFRLLHSHLTALSNNHSKGTCIKGGFERAFVALFDHDIQTFTGSMLQNLNQLEKQLNKEEFQETGSIDAFQALMTQFQTFISFRYYFDDFDGTEIRQFHDTLIQHMESLRESIL